MRGRVGTLGALVLSLALLSCSPPGSTSCEDAPPLSEGPCGEGFFRYQDPLCGPVPPDAGAGSCTEAGDGLCHRECASDADCTDPCRPYCRQLGLYNGGDFNCNRVVTICRAEDRDDCAR